MEGCMPLLHFLYQSGVGIDKVAKLTYRGVKCAVGEQAWSGAGGVRGGSAVLSSGNEAANPDVAMAASATAAVAAWTFFMISVQNIEIRDFRGIGELKLADISRMNFVIGRNNSCKSALLEALALAASFPTFRDAFRVTLPTWVVVRRGKPYAPHLLVSTGSSEASVKINTTKNEIVLKLYTDSKVAEQREELAKLVKRIREREARLIRMPAPLGAVRSPLEELEEYEDRVERIYAVAESGSETSAFVVSSTGDVVIAEVSKNIGPRSVVFLDSRLFLDSRYVARVVDMLTLSNIKRFDDVIGAIKKYTGISDIRIARDEVPYARVEGAGYLPLSALGDGVRSAILYAFSLAFGDVIIMEEPEVHMHAKLMDMLIHLIATSQQQYFISTHSSDFVHKALALADNLNKLSDIRVIRLRNCKVVDVLAGRDARFLLEEQGRDIHEV